MRYKVEETRKAVDDIVGFSEYMIEKFGNSKAAYDFVKKYNKAILQLETFPFGYRGISFEYQGREIQLKPYGTYNIFFVVDREVKKITILRVLKDRQNWKEILAGEEYIR